MVESGKEEAIAKENKRIVRAGQNHMSELLVMTVVVCLVVVLIAGTIKLLQVWF